jgi:protein SCO1/2
MRREQKILVTTLWALAVLGMLGLVATGVLARRQADKLEFLFDAPPFTLVDQNNQTVTDASLKGNVWVGMLFFTQCPGVCPMMTGRMVQLQKAIPDKDVKIVSFSVDPEHDTPAAMKAYAEKSQVDESRWHLLTGPKELMFAVAIGLKLPAAPAHDDQPIVHSQRVLLFDRGNHVRGVYDTNDDDSMQKLANDVRTLLAEPMGRTS